MDGMGAPPERRRTTALADGRRLAWAEWGPEDGVPVLLCPGAGASGRLGFGEAEVARRGVRLLAIDRPGLGGSDPDPAKSFATWAADVRAWRDARGLAGLRAVGFSQGAPFACALAAAGLVERLALVAGQDELDHPALRPRLPAEVAAMLDAVRADAAAFEARIAGMADAEGMWALVMGMSGEADRRWYAAPAFAAAYREALAEGFARGAAGYARDLALALGPWPFRAEEIDVPVDLWYGARDTSPVHSPDLGETLAARFPRATRTVDPDAGGAILWTRAADILARLA